MNKYLTAYNEIIDMLDKKIENSDEKFGGSASTLLIKSQIAEELNDYYGQGGEWELTDKDQEELVDIIYDFWLEIETNDYTIATHAVCDAMGSYDNFENFLNMYEEDYAEVHDNFVWCLSSAE